MRQPFDNYGDFWRAWHDSKRMAAPFDRLVFPSKKIDHLLDTPGIMNTI